MMRAWSGNPGRTGKNALGRALIYLGIRAHNGAYGLGSRLAYKTRRESHDPTSFRFDHEYCVSGRLSDSAKYGDIGNCANRGYGRPSRGPEEYDGQRR